jgi:polar amino acid transport system substrate-binding protein
VKRDARNSDNFKGKQTMKNMLIALAIAGLLFPVGTVPAEQLVFTTSEWPPYVMPVSENGKLSGLNAETVLELCSRLGFEADMQIVPWKRALAYAKEGKADAIFAPRYTKERAEFLYYPSEPLNLEKTVLFARKGSGIKISKLDDLKGKMVGTVRGYNYGPEFDNCLGLERAESDNDRQLLKILSKNRVPLIISSDEGTVKYLCKQAGVEAEVVYVLNKIPSYIAFSKAKGERGKVLAERFGKMLRKLKEEGFVQKIEGKYF